jgi:hypothetical protein
MEDKEEVMQKPALMDEQTATLISKMEFISLAQPGKKPCFSTMQYVGSDPTSDAYRRILADVTTSLYRRLWSESRNSLLENINTIVNDLNIAMGKNDQNKEILTITARGMIRGLEVIRETYRGQLDFTTKLTPIFINIRRIIGDPEQPTNT